VNANNLIEFKSNRRGMLLQLPPRSLGKAKRFGWLPVMFSLFPIGFAASWLTNLFPMIFKGPPAGMGGVDIFLVAFTAIGLVPLWFGLKVFALGIAILLDQTYTSVEITKENLISYESFFGFSFKRKVPSQPIKELVILATSRKMQTSILVAYPTEILTEAASLIRKELDDIQFQLPSSRHSGETAESQTVASNARIKIIDISQEAKLPPSERETSSLQATPSVSPIVPIESSTAAPPPADSLLKVTHQDGTDVYEVPPQGWRKGGAGLALFWNGFMLLATLLVMFSKPQNPAAGVWEIVGIVAFLSLFWAIGIGLAIWAWNSAKRSAMIGVSGDQMFVETKSIFGTKWVEFNQSEIHSISVQDSDMSVNDVPIKHLVVETEDQPPRGLFANLANEELHWLAGRLKGSLKFKRKNRLNISTAFNDDGDIIAPASTRLKVDRGVGPTYIEVPAALLGKQLITLFFFALSVVFVTGVFWFPAQQLDFGLVIFLTLFGSIFVITTLSSFLCDSRRWTIAASRERLTITRRWPLGTKETTFEPEEIKKICIGTTGFKTSNQRHYQLVVHTHQQKKAMTLMSNWSVKELKYVAATIYDALEIDQKPAE